MFIHSIWSTFKREDGTEILQVVGLLTAIMLVLGGTIAVSSAEDDAFGAQITSQIRYIDKL